MKSISAIVFATVLSAAPLSFAADAIRHDEHLPDTLSAKSAPVKPATPHGANGQMMMDRMGLPAPSK